MMPKKLIVLLLAPIAAVVWAQNISGFETDTHTLLSLRATETSQLNSFLTTVLGFEFPQGIVQEIGQGDSPAVIDLIAKIGAVNEDSPFYSHSRPLPRSYKSLDSSWSLAIL